MRSLILSSPSLEQRLCHGGHTPVCFSTVLVMKNSIVTDYWRCSLILWLHIAHCSHSSDYGIINKWNHCGFWWCVARETLQVQHCMWVSAVWKWKKWMCLLLGTGNNYYGEGAGSASDANCLGKMAETSVKKNSVSPHIPDEEDSTGVEGAGITVIHCPCKFS